MHFRQFVDEDLGCASYLIGDRSSGRAVVVDPAFAIEQYVEAAAEAGVRIERVLETHTHADHLSGHGRLALEHGIPVSIHPIAEPAYPFDSLADGEVLELGAVRIRVVHTPGHRPEHCAFVVDEQLVLTGDSLFVGDAARPDLAIEARAGAADLFHSLQRLAALPDSVVVYPGHVSGSLCGTNMSPDRSTSIGRERTTNHALKETDVAVFVDDAASISVPRPPTTERVVRLNRGPWVGARAPLEELVGPDVAPVLDVRPVADFVAGHVPGAISVALDGGSFATRAAFVLDPEAPFVLHVRSGEEARAASRLLCAVGVFGALGYVTTAPVVVPLPTLTVAELATLIEGAEVQLVDVREAGERAVTPIEALPVPYRVVAGSSPPLDPDRPVYTICEAGARATLAASILVGKGYDARAVVGGGASDLALLLHPAAPG